MRTDRQRAGGLSRLPGSTVRVHNLHGQEHTGAGSSLFLNHFLLRSQAASLFSLLSLAVLLLILVTPCRGNDEVQESLLSTAREPNVIAAGLEQLRSRLTSLQYSGTFETKTFSENWAIASNGAFLTTNDQGRLLMKSELAEFRFAGAPPDYLREVAVRASILHQGPSTQLSRALFGFRRATPALKFDVPRAKAVNARANWDHFQVDHGHPIPIFGNGQQGANLVALLIPDEAIRLIEKGQLVGDRINGAEVIAEDHQRRAFFSWLSPQTAEAINSNRNSSNIDSPVWELTIQSVHPDTQFVRLESTARWGLAPLGGWIPLQLKTEFHHNSSWNWSVLLSFAETSDTIDPRAKEFDLANMLFDPVTARDVDPPHVTKTYELLKQLHSISNR